MKDSFKKRLFRISGNVFALLMGVALALALGEMGARVHMFGLDAFSYEKVQSFGSLFRMGLVQRSATEGLFYELRPDLDMTFKTVPFKTNRYGMRDGPCEPEKPERTYRVAMIGDSFTMGSGVEHRYLFHTIVEHKLNEMNDSIRYELLNFGVGGYGLSDYLAVLKHKAIGFHPDEVVIGFCAYNDHIIPEAGTAPDTIPPPDPNGFRISYLKRLIDLTFFNKYQIRHYAYTPERLKYVQTQLMNIRTVADEHHIPVSVIYLSNTYRPKESAQIRSIAEGLGMKFADTSFRFRGKNISDYSLHVFDAHPDRKANRIFSEELLRLIGPEKEPDRP